MYPVTSCNISVIQQDTQYLMINFIRNIQQLNMFRNSIVHLHERSYAVCCNLVCLDTSCCYRNFFLILSHIAYLIFASADTWLTLFNNAVHQELARLKWKLKGPPLNQVVSHFNPKYILTFWGSLCVLRPG
jgi:hypothetical protein